MTALSIETMSLRGQTQGDQQREHAAKVANQFESVFVKTLVKSLRQTSSVGDESGSMFGSGPGADTYASWFDNNVADELAKGRGIGIAEMLIHDMERHGEIDAQVEQAGRGLQAARAAKYQQITMATKGGLDVVLR